MSTERPPTFEYSPLESGQIRLLKPNLGDPTGLITWELDAVALPDDGGKAVVPPDYDALSYTWGKQEDESFPMVCNGKTLEVHRNLYIALPYLAKRLQQAGSSPRRIWIDAVCINQKDDKVEKPKQIARMADVYRSARQVLVWLGPGHGEYYNYAAIALVPLITQICEAAFKHTMDSREPEPDFSNKAMPAESSPIWKALSDIVFNDWFTRLWVVQELALARSTVALIGESTLDFESLGNLMGFLPSAFWGEIRNPKLGPGVKTLQKEGMQRNVDIMRLVNNTRFIVLHGVLNDTADVEPRLTSSSQEIPAMFTRSCDVLSPTVSISTTVPFPSQQSSIQKDLEYLLTALNITTMSQQCTVAQDRVFGVLAFLGNRAETKALGLERKWDESELAKLYIVFLGYVFEQGGQFTQDPGRRFLWELFSFACLPNKMAGLPTWCPDLHMQRGPNTPFGLSFQAKRGFSASDEDRVLGYGSTDYFYAADGGVMNMRRGSSQNTFVVKGTVFGCLKEVYPPFPEPNLRPGLDELSILKMNGDVGQWEQKIASRILDQKTPSSIPGQRASSRMSGQKITRKILGQKIASRILGPKGDRAEEGAIVSVDTYWRTLVGNRTSLSEGDSNFTCETLYSLRDFFVRLARLKTKLEELIVRYGSCEAAFKEGGYTSTEEYQGTIALRLSSPPEAFARNMGEVQIGRQLFTTADGRFGFGNVGIQEGDVVCIFNGAVTPHVLRKVDGDDGSYKLVAAAYIHGMMNGEIHELGLEAEDINLI